MDNYTVVELRQKAKKRGFVGYSKLLKSDLIKLLKRRVSPKPAKRAPGGDKRVSDDWFIVTKSGCGYCKKAKELLDSKNMKFETHELTNVNKDDIYNKLDSLTGKYRYFPMIFNKGKFIGGYTDLEKKLNN